VLDNPVVEFNDESRSSSESELVLLLFIYRLVDIGDDVRLIRLAPDKYSNWEKNLKIRKLSTIVPVICSVPSNED